jgi:branched-chain amino acid transport system substrate-binding protein
VNLRWTILLANALLAGAAQAAPGDRTDIVRDLAGRVGPMVGSELACRDIARPQFQVIIDKFTTVITPFSSSAAERADLAQLLDGAAKELGRQMKPGIDADYSYGDAGFAGGAKAFGALGVDDSDILRLNYQRNTVDVDDAVNQLKRQRPPIKAVAMVAVHRAAANKFIEKTHDLFTGMIYTNASGVGGTALADELLLLGSHYASGVVVSQVVPAVSGYSSLVLDCKNSLAKYFPGNAADYVSLEGFISANILIEAIKRTGPQLDTGKLIDVQENVRNLDLGLGVPLGFGRAEHQASHKIRGTAIDENGKYQAIELE